MPPLPLLLVYLAPQSFWRQRHWQTEGGVGNGLKTSSCENVNASGGRGPIGSNPLKGIKEEQGDSACGIIPVSLLDIADEFLFDF